MATTTMFLPKLFEELNNEIILKTSGIARITRAPNRTEDIKQHLTCYYATPAGCHVRSCMGPSATNTELIWPCEGSR